jgi:hypothetical protein
MVMSSREEWFDLARDPGEAHDLAFERPEALAASRDALANALRAFASGSGMQPAVGEAIEPLSEAERRELEALGYLE